MKLLNGGGASGQARWDRARWYTINGRRLPSVTTILSVIDKSGPLMAWAVKEQDKAWGSALLEILSGSGAKDPEFVLSKIADAMHRVRAAEREKNKAATIGTAAHAMIEWKTRQMLGEKVGAEPVIPDAAHMAVMAWEDWTKAVQFEPLWIERTVYCLECGYAGTADWVAKVKGVVTLGDYKTGRAIYPEAYLQNCAYRHAAEKLGMATEQGIILRLPKVVDDPAFEAQFVPDTALNDFLAALRLWTWQRRAEGSPVGT